MKKLSIKRKPKVKKRKLPKPTRRLEFWPMPEGPDDVPDMYWEGEDGEGYKEDGCPWVFTE